MDESEELKSGPESEELESGPESENNPSPETNGRSWLETQKSRLKELGTSFFTTEQYGVDKFMNVLGKVDGLFVAAAGSYIAGAADKLAPAGMSPVPAEMMGGSIILLGLGAAGAATYETWRQRHQAGIEADTNGGK